MKPWFISLAPALSALALISGRGLPAAEGIYIDLSQWISPDITSVADDPFVRFVKYGHMLFTDTANEIGPGTPREDGRGGGVRDS